MTEYNANDFKGTLDFFVLSGFSDGPQSLSNIQKRVEWAERLLYLAAVRKGKQDFGSLSEALERLHADGCVKLERRGERPDAEVIYSLTHAGEHRLQQERARRSSMVSQLVEESELDTSFRKFLDRKGPASPH